MPETTTLTPSNPDVPAAFNDLVDELQAESAVPDGFNDLIFEMNPQRQSIVTLKPAQIQQIERAQQAARNLSSIPVGESVPESDTNALSDAFRGVGRATFSTIEGAASLPRAILEAAPGDPKGGTLDFIVSLTTDNIAKVANFSAHSELLAADPGSEKLFSIDWWTNRFPELASSAVVTLVPGLAASKIAILAGLSRKTATLMARATSLAFIVASEGGSTFNDLVAQLRAKGVPDADARDIASRGALFYAIVSGSIEAKFLKFLGGGRSKTALMRIVRGGVGEASTEEMQLLAQWATVAMIEANVELELRPILTAQNIIETGIGAFAGGAALGPITAPVFGIDEQVAEAMQQVAEITGLPIETIEKLVADQVEADPILSKEAESETEPTAPTGEVQKPVEPEQRPKPISFQSEEEIGIKPSRFTKISLRKTVSDEFPELAIGSRSLGDTKNLSQADRAEDLLDTSELGSDFARLIARVFIMDKRGQLNNLDIGKLVGIKASDLAVGDEFQIDEATIRVVEATDTDITIELIENETPTTKILDIETPEADRTIEKLTIPRDKTLPANEGSFGRPVFEAVVQKKPVEAAVTPTGEDGPSTIAQAQEVTSTSQQSTDAQKSAAVQQIVIESQRRSDSDNKRVDDLIQEVIANLPDVLTKEQAKTLIVKATNATTQKQLQKVIRDVRKAEGKVRQTKAQDRLKKLLGKIDLNTLAPEVRSAMVELIGQLDTQSLSPDKKKALESLQDHIKRGGRVPNRVKAELDRLGKSSISKLSEAEATEIADELTSAVVQASKARAIRLRRKKRELSVAVDAVVAEIEREQGARFSALMKPFRDSKDPISFLVSTAISQEQASIFESLLELLSGSDQTATVDVLFNQVADAHNTMLERGFRLKDEREAFMRTLGITDDQWLQWTRPTKTTLDKVLQALGRGRKTKDIEVIKLPSGKTIEMYKAERTSILEQLMDTETFDLLVFDNVPIWLPGMDVGDSIVLSSEDLRTLVDSATEQERALARWTVEKYNGEEADAYGEASRIVFGRSRVRPGRYVPRHRVNEDKDTEFDAKFFRQKAIKNARINLERNPNDKTNPIKIVDTFANFDSWSTMHSALIDLAPAVEQALAIVQSNDFRTAIRKRHSKAVLQRIESYYNELMRETVGGSAGNEILGRKARFIFNNISRGLLFGRPQVAGYQFGSYFTLMTELNPADVNASLGAFINGSLDAEIFANSPFLRQRSEGGGTRLVETSDRGDERVLKSFRHKGKFSKVVDMAGAGMIRSVDGGVIRVAWAAAKSQATREGFESQALLDRTQQLAEKAVRRTQPTWDSLSITGLALEARTSGLSRALNFFRAMRSKNVDMTKMAIARRVRGQISQTEFNRIMVLVNVAQPMYITAVRWTWRSILSGGVGALAFGLTGKRVKEEEKELAEQTKSFMADVFSTVVGNLVLGDIPDGVIRTLLDQPAFEAQISPASSLVSNMSRSLMGMAGGMREQDVTRLVIGSLKASEAAMVLFGIPPGPSIKILTELIKEVQKRDKGKRKSSSGSGAR